MKGSAPGAVRGEPLRYVWVHALIAAAALVCGAARSAPPLSAYGRLPALEMVTLSPSGNEIAFVAVDGESRKLFVRNVGGDAIIADGAGNSKIRELLFAGEDHVLVFASYTFNFRNGPNDKWTHRTRAELGVMLAVNLKTHAITRIFDHDETAVAFGAIDHIYGAHEIDGRWCVFVHAYSVIGNGHVYKVDLDTGKYTIIDPLTGDDYGYYLGQGGEIAARIRYDYASRSSTLYSGSTGNEVVFTRPSPFASLRVDGAGRTPGTLVVSDTLDHRDVTQEYPLSSHAEPTTLFDGSEVESMLRDPTSGLLLGALMDHGSRAILFDPRFQRRFDAAIKAFPGYRVHLVSHSADFGRMVVLTDGADDSGTYWLIDMATGKATDLLGAYPDVGPKDVGPTRMFAYHASDGTPLDGVLTLPPGSSGKALPLVVMPHGGPIGFDDAVGFDWLAQAFASRGYAVLQPNYRGSSGRGVAFRESGFGEWGRKMLSDIADGVQALGAAGIADPKRACIVGASYGGYAALAGVTVQHGLYRCAVSISGVSDVGGILAYSGDSDRSPVGRDNQRKFGVRSAEDESLRRISPVRLAASADAPILLIHGKDDTVVPFVHSASMATALEKLGKTYKLVATEGEDHYLSRAATRTQTITESVAWVEKYDPVQ